MKKLLCLILAVVLLMGTLSITAFAAEEVMETGVYYYNIPKSLTEYGVTVLPSTVEIDAESELNVKEAYVEQSCLQMTTDDV